MRLWLVAIAALAACSAPEERPAAAPRPIDPVVAGDDAAAAATDAAVVVATADAAPPEPARAARIELTFVGDLMFGGYFDDHYDPQQVERHDPLVDVDALLVSDLAFGNLETTITRKLPNHGNDHDGTGHKRFVTIPERVAVLARHHLKTVTLANNHQLDNDNKGLVETVEILGELGIAFVGAARSGPPRFRVETVDVKGWRIGFIAASTQMNRSPRKSLVPYVSANALRAELVPVIAGARADHDLIVLALHWGHEYEDVPARWQIDAAHAFVDAGADVIMGHHPHVLQGIERYRGGVIAYSLGNFVFPNAKERIRETGVLRLGFSSRAKPCLDLAVFHPAIQIRSPLTHPVPANPSQHAFIAKRFFALSAARPLSTKWETDGERFVTTAACAK
jgi:poly-gamma-glutamate synthesis protein (capsule biosynthesis protein)